MINDEMLKLVRFLRPREARHVVQIDRSVDDQVQRSYDHSHVQGPQPSGVIRRVRNVSLVAIFPLSLKDLVPRQQLLVRGRSRRRKTAITPVYQARNRRLTRNSSTRKSFVFNICIVRTTSSSCRDVLSGHQPLTCVRCSKFRIHMIAYSRPPLPGPSTNQISVMGLHTRG